MVDEELLRPSREYLARLGAEIKRLEAQTAQKIERYGHGDKEYAREAWGEFYRAVEPMRREQEGFAKIIADYYALQTVPPPIVVP